jgi:hypothetical protein
VYVRLDYNRDAPPPADQIKHAITSALGRGFERLSEAGETLWEFLHRRDAGWSSQSSPSGRTLTPLLIFDQFEEIFTLGQSDDVSGERATQFKEELADALGRGGRSRRRGAAQCHAQGGGACRA